MGPPAPEGFATYFTIAVATAATSGWPGRNTGSRLIWRADLPDTRTVWLVAHERPVDDWMQQHLAEFKRSAVPATTRMVKEAGYSEIEDMRAIIYYRDEDPRMRFYLDVSCVEPQG